MTEEKDFDFMKDEEPKEEEPKEELSFEEQLEEAKIDNVILQEKLDNRGKVTPAIIKEARELAATPRGMDIEKFMDKYKLVNVNIEQLLQAPLDKDGNYA